MKMKSLMNSASVLLVASIAGPYHEVFAGKARINKDHIVHMASIGEYVCGPGLYYNWHDDSKTPPVLVVKDLLKHGDQVGMDGRKIEAKPETSDLHEEGPRQSVKSKTEEHTTKDENDDVHVIVPKQQAAASSALQVLRTELTIESNSLHSKI